MNILLRFSFATGFLIAVSLTQGLRADFSNVQISLPDGTTIEGSVETIDANGLIAGEGIPAGLTLDRILSLSTGRDVDAGDERAVKVRLAGGGVVSARTFSITEELVTIESDCGLSSLRLENLRGVIWVDSDQAQQRLQSPSNEFDTVMARSSSGLRGIEGLLESISESKVFLNYKGKSQSISLDKVEAVIVADLGLANSEGNSGTVTMVDGSTISGVVGAMEAGSLAVKLPGGSELALDTSLVAEIKINSENLIYLSNLNPSSVEQQNSFAIERLWQRDLSVEGNNLTLSSDSSGETIVFQKGIGTSSYSRLDFSNENGFNRFMAVVGIDVETGGRGDCVATVLGDGIQLWSQRITASDEPANVDVDITGLETISLVVDPGEEFDLADHLNWCDARFTKSR